MSKNIVICCDGTGNEIEDNQSNVLKFYRVLKRSERQLVYYEPGVGTLGAQNEWARIKQNTEKIIGLALGYGLDRNVLDAYRFLVVNYVEGDRLFLLGFSRGAYTARVLAGFINSIGLLRPEQINLCGYALVAYKQVTEGGGFLSVRTFERTLRPRRPPIRFVGLWDTVSTVIVPRKDRLFVPTLRQLAYTARNPSVEAVRHALAVDERRRMFRPFLWNEAQEYWGGPFKPKDPQPQDVKQVWFVGVHCDVGGGYAEAESGLSKLALKWMIDESPDELEFETQRVNQIVLGKVRAGSKRSYAEPDPKAPLHQSLTRGWWPIEWLPKRAARRDWPERKCALGVYVPNAEPRVIGGNGSIHPSVWNRVDGDADYAPINLPAAD